MYIKYNPLDEKYKSITGGVAENTAVRFFVESDADELKMSVCSDNRLIALCFEKKDDGFHLEKSFERGLYFYRLIALKEGKEVVFAADNNLLPEAVPFSGIDGGYGYSCGVFDWQLTVYAEDYVTPDVVKGGIIYQIFPDRFCRSGDFWVSDGKIARYDWGGLPTFRSPDGVVRNNEFFGGNFKGIESKLDYLSSLNVTCVYLNPVCKSYSSHRYDTGDYMQPDEVLGTAEDMQKVALEGGKRGIRFIFDGVFNHTGADSKYFNKYGNYDSVGAYQSTLSPYFDWYSFREYPDDYDSWWNFKTLPAIRKDCENFQSFVCDKGGVLDYWLKVGFKGVRLDVADELTDDFIKKIRATIKRESADNLLIGEVWEDATNKIAYGIRRRYFVDGELDSVMNYPLKDAICDFVLSGNCDFLARTVREQINNYPKAALDCLMNVLSTHDSARAITLFGRKTAIYNKDEMAGEKLSPEEYNRGKLRLKCASVVQFFLYGIPTVYYGDEEGLEGDLDPYNRRCFNWDNPDEELLTHYRKIAKIRTEYKNVLAKGDTKIVYEKGGLFVFSRTSGNGSLLIAVNVSQTAYILNTDENAVDLYGGKGGKSFELKPYEFCIIDKA